MALNLKTIQFDGVLDDYWDSNNFYYHQLKIKTSLNTQVNETINRLTTEIKIEFPNYRHSHIDFKNLMHALVLNEKDLFVSNPTFQKEIKHNTKLFLNFFNVIRNETLVDELKKSMLPILAQDMGGNRTEIKRLIFAIFLSNKSSLRIKQIFEEISRHKKNNDPVFVLKTYRVLIGKLRHFRALKDKIKTMPYKTGLLERAKILAQEHQFKNELRVKLLLSPLEKEEDDPHRPLPRYLKTDDGHQLLNQKELWEYDPVYYLKEIQALPD